MTPSPAVEASFEVRHHELRTILRGLRDPQERLAWVVERSRARQPIATEDRTDARLVPGCAARLWLVAELQDGRCRFACDSDSAILKAAAGLLCDLYDGLTVDDVQHGEPTALAECGLMSQLTENRRRTILRVREAIRSFATGDRTG
jgi:cysteine desulfuration protein SufE